MCKNKNRAEGTADVLFFFSFFFKKATCGRNNGYMNEKGEVAEVEGEGGVEGEVSKKLNGRGAHRIKRSDQSM